MNSSSSGTFGDCSDLQSRTDFPAYVQQLNATTGFSSSLLDACKGDICNAIWGDGNTDISGIGMVVGYFFESILGFLIAIGIAVVGPLSTTSRIRDILVDLCRIFFDCAIFFAASIQISCMVVLIRRDFGISANGLGGFTVQITWAVALNCMLPLIYPMVILTFTDVQQNKEHRKNYRLLLFCGCWITFSYCFISQMIGDYGPSQVGTGAGDNGATIITDEEWNKLTSLCLTGVRPLNSLEQSVLSIFGAVGSSFVTLFGLCQLLWFIFTRLKPTGTVWFNKTVKLGPEWCKSPRNIMWTLLILVPLLSIPQFWGILRLREIQRELADSTNKLYVDNQWTFGQVVAVMIFTPVITETVYLWLHR